MLYARINTGPQCSVDRSIQYSKIPPMGIRILLLVLLLPSTIQARPVSYSGGSTIMLFSDDKQGSVYYHYSPNYTYSIGIEMVDTREQADDYARFRFTYLLDRKNTKRSQRNLYFESGLNAGGDKENFYGLMGDWETRQYFVGFGAREFESDTRSHSKQFIQLGFAPYVGEYGDLHSWLMVKSKRTSSADDWNTYPMLRFFKGDYFLEVGVDENEKLDLHFMVRI